MFNNCCVPTEDKDEETKEFIFLPTGNIIQYLETILKLSWETFIQELVKT